MGCLGQASTLTYNNRGNMWKSKDMTNTEKKQLNKWVNDQAKIIGFHPNSSHPFQRTFHDLVNRWAIKHDPTGTAGLDANEPMTVIFLRASKAHDNHKWLLQQINK